MARSCKDEPCPPSGASVKVAVQSTKKLLILHGDDRSEVLGAIAFPYGQVHHSPQLRDQFLPYIA